MIHFLSFTLMFLGLHLAITTTASGGGGDSTPGGATDVWMWEADTGVLWESGYFMQTE